MQRTHSWQHTGQWAGGTILALAPSPHFSLDGTLLAATQAGLLRTTDRGESWQWVMEGLSDPLIVALATAPDTEPGSSLAFAATGSGRLYTSTNMGAEWTEIPAFAGLGVASALALSPNYAQDHSLFVATSQGVYRTLNGGVTWEHSIFGLLDADILCLRCAPDFGHSQVLWCGAALGGLYRSRNAALAWRDAGLGLPDAAIQCLLPYEDTQGRNVILAGAEEHGLFRSRDDGRTWQLASPDLAGVSVNCMAAQGDGATLVVGAESGVLRSIDGGASWHETEGGEFAAMDLAWADGETLFAATFQEGIFRSQDGGRSWRPAGAGIVAHAAPLTVQRADGTLMAADRDGACVLSQDQGQSWHFWTADPDPAPVMTLGDGGWIATDGALYPPPDQGKTKISLPSGSQSPAILAVTQEKNGQGALLLADETGMLYLASPAPAAWRTLVPPAPGQNLLAAQLSPFFGQDATLYAVTGMPTESGAIQLQAWLSADGGEGWSLLADLESASPALLLAAGADEVERPLFLAFQNRLVKFSKQAVSPSSELEWGVHQHFFDTDFRVSALVISPQYVVDQSLWVGGNQGVWCSEDGGQTWEVVGHGLPSRPVVGLHPDGTGMTAVLLGGQVWRCETG